MKKGKNTYRLDCRFFGGYKPCRSYKICKGCKDYDKIGKRILIINLDALGDVLKTTALLASIKRKYRNSFITWLTGQGAYPLLLNNPHVDRIYTFDLESSLALMRESFNILFNADKTKQACALTNIIDAKEKLGFGLSRSGAIIPLNKKAKTLYAIGLDDELKFFKNKESNQKLLAGAWGLDYKRDEYVLQLTKQEKDFVFSFRKKNNIKDKDFVIGINTGSSNTYPYKRLTISKQIELIRMLKRRIPKAKIALVGGKEDIERNNNIVKAVGNKIINTPCNMGLRKGVLFIGACDLIVTGDTVALHIAIALKKPVVAWFGISCENEIDLYNRGLKVISRVNCRPCWKRECNKKIKCNETVSLNELVKAVLIIYKKYAKK